jgi:hypothetical protein
VRDAILVRPVGEEVLAVVIVDGGAHKGLRGGDFQTSRQGFKAEGFMPCTFLRPHSAPVRPLRDAGHQSAQIIWIDASRFIAWNEV